jgi:hypothetical protein
MKNIALVLSLFSLSALAAAPALDDVNAAVADLLKPYNTEVSKAELQAQALTADDANLPTARVTGTYQRVGKVQTMTVRLAGLSYDFANGAPLVNLTGNLAFDLTQVFQQDQINGHVDGSVIILFVIVL